jgi:ferric-dicitrate binding protein FerR (iron transport regulator)
VKGRFRTRGRNSTATVRGTQYLVKDTCKGTLTKVTAGTVVVRDLTLRRTKVLRAGRSYLAHPPRLRRKR